MPSSAPTPAERAIAAAFYAPIGLGAQLVDDLPRALNTARQQIVFARFIGKMAVDQGLKELRQRISPSGVGPQPDVAQVSEPVDSPDEAAAPEPSTEMALSPDELALPDYDQLPASHIVSKLAGLMPSELDAIEAYEIANRNRRTVLGKVAQLQVT
jgi:hypothetical protein